MDAGCVDLDSEALHTDTFPLLMDQTASEHEHHIVTVSPGSTDFLAGSLVQNEGNNGSTSSQNETIVNTETLARDEASTLSRSGGTTSFNSSHVGPMDNALGSRQRPSPLNSRLWISIEFTIAVSQIVASIVVLTLSRDEKPQAPLSVWVAGYAAGCFATLPLVYWRYKHRYVPVRERDAPPQSREYTSNHLEHASSYATLSNTVPSHGEETHTNSQTRWPSANRVSSSENPRMGQLVEKFKIALDCFFAVWFVVGNVWIFGGHSSSSEAPNLYRLCIVFLTLSCIGYAMPFILCATICCCLPCIIALLGFREEQTQQRGASPETIAALPIYKFKVKSSPNSRMEKDSSDSDGEGSGEGGFVGCGTENERCVSGEDSVCCICLGKYKNGVELKELPCTHHFHVDCVDKWLKISASCPLCKHEIEGSGDQDVTATNEATNEAGSRTLVSQEAEV